MRLQEIMIENGYTISVELEDINLNKILEVRIAEENSSSGKWFIFDRNTFTEEEAIKYSCEKFVIDNGLMLNERHIFMSDYYFDLSFYFSNKYNKFQNVIEENEDSCFVAWLYLNDVKVKVKKC